MNLLSQHIKEYAPNGVRGKAVKSEEEQLRKLFILLL